MGEVGRFLIFRDMGFACWWRVKNRTDSVRLVFKAHVDSVQFQVVGDAMALAAAAKLADDRLGVGFRVAFLAGGDGFVSGGMAFGAGNITVLGSTVSE